MRSVTELYTISIGKCGMGLLLPKKWCILVYLFAMQAGNFVEFFELVRNFVFVLSYVCIMSHSMHFQAGLCYIN